MIDLIDRKLLFELNWNCRQTDTKLGKRLRISKQVVNYRIKQFEKKEIIQNYFTLIDWRKLGYNAIRIYLKWKSINPSVEKEIYEFIKENPLFMWTVKFEGEFDVGFYIWTKSILEFAEKWFSFLTKYKKYILKQEICESVNMTHYPMKPLLDSSISQEKTLGNGNVTKYDDVDYKILQQITRNARISSVELGRIINLTPKAIIYRLRQLEKKGIILGYNALIDTKKLGYQFYKIDFYLNNLTRIKEMIEFAKQHPKIVYLMRTIGGPDYEIEIMIKETDEINQIIQEIRTKFTDTIEHNRFHRFEHTIKQIYLPGETKKKDKNKDVID